MGLFWSKQNEKRILILGLDAAGKTTLLYRLKLGEVVTTIPTIGFNVETISHCKISICAWDVGGRGKIRPLYRHYFANTDALLYIIDANDQERFEQSKDELQSFLKEDELRDVPLLIVVNKIDLAGAAKGSDVVKAMGLHELRSRVWCMAEVSAKDGRGLDQMLDYLTALLRKQTVLSVTRQALALSPTKEVEEKVEAVRPSASRVLASALGLDFIKAQLKRLVVGT